jgi:hypothetical protein
MKFTIITASTVAFAGVYAKELHGAPVVSPCLAFTGTTTLFLKNDDTLT